MGSGSPSNVTQTTQTQLPAWLESANQFGSSQAQSLYNQGGAPYYPGATVAPFSPMQEQYMGAVENQATGGNPALNAASNYATNAANGAYLNSNPYLDQTFDNAANAVQNQVSSEFGASGRNLEASIPVQNDQMNQLATQIYGGNYANAQQLQSQAAYMAPALNAANQSNLQMLGTAGDAQQTQAQNLMGQDQNEFNYYAQLPYSNLTNYMNTVNTLSHGSTTSNTQPVYQNQTASALGGAMSGAATGAAVGSIVPGLGTGVGALVGGGIGLLGGYFG